MKFDENRVYTALNADELKIGSFIIGADTISILKDRINDAAFIDKLKAVLPEDCPRRFEAKDYNQFSLCYLVSETELFYVHLCDEHYVTEPKFSSKYVFFGSEKDCYEYVKYKLSEKYLKWTDLKIGDVIRKGIETYMVIGIENNYNGTHILTGQGWLSDEELKEWRKVELC